jgi:hypothetical protein
LLLNSLIYNIITKIQARYDESKSFDALIDNILNGELVKQAKYNVSETIKHLGDKLMSL